MKYLNPKKHSIKIQHQVESDEIDPVLKISDRSIHNFYYTVIRNHMDLGDLADKKANLLLGVSAVIFSLLIAKIYLKITTLNDELLVIPFVILIVSSVTTVILAVIVTRPEITEGKFQKKDLEAKNVNLAFFGNFHSMDFDEYNWAVIDMLKDKDDIHATLTKDLYFLGKVLNKKYRVLNAAYLVFITGFALAIISAMFLIKF